MSKEKILIVIDVQKDFVDGSLGTPEAQAIVPRIEEKIRNGGYDKVLYTFDTHYLPEYWESSEGKKLPVDHCIKGTPGWCSALSTNKGKESIIEKDTFGYLRWNSYIYYINRNSIKRKPWGEEDDTDIIVTESIDLVGLCTDICVVTNALILKTYYPEIPITVDASCCAGTTPEAHKAALAVMKSCQIDVINE